MVIPLPNLITSQLLQKSASCNLSALFYKWPAVYLDNTFVALEQKSTFVQDNIIIADITEHRKALALRMKHFDKIGVGFTLKTGSRLVVGLGYQHPLETGFLFDWTSGLPVIPGSSLKGITRSYVEDWDEEIFKNENKEKTIGDIFGTPAKAGKIIFFPAYPAAGGVTKHFFELDVMTPHYMPYYSDPDHNPPADWYSPNPVKFLTVAPEIEFTFRIADRCDFSNQNSELLTKAASLLKYALTIRGVGAKTNVGYGWFKEE